MSESKLIMLKNRSEGSFHRYVRDKKGNPIKKLVFLPMAPLELKGRDLKAVEDDIGHALMEVEMEVRTSRATTKDRGKEITRERPKPVRADKDSFSLNDDVIKVDDVESDDEEGFAPQLGSPNSSEPGE